MLEKKKKAKSVQTTGHPLSSLCKSSENKQTNKQTKKTLALQITATSGILVTDIFYSYTCALKIRFNNKNPNPTGPRGKNSGGQLDYCVAN